MLEKNIKKVAPYSIRWNCRDDKYSSTVNVALENIDFNDTSRWTELIAFLVTTYVALKAELITACTNELHAAIDGN